jgi:hypothetical protein
MVNSPKIRHSKPRRDPVTIDLEPDFVSKPEPPAAKGGESEAIVVSENAKSDDASASVPTQSSSMQKPLLDEFPAAKPAAESASSQPAPGGRDTRAGDAAKSASGPKPDGSPPPSTPAPPKSEPARRGSGVSAIAAGIIGGVIALAGGGVLQYAGLLPVPGGNATSSAEVEGLRSEFQSLREQLAAAPAAENLAPRIDQLAAALEEAKSQIAAVASGGAASPEAAQALEDRFKAIEAAVAAAQSAGSGAPADLGPLREQLGGLDAALAELKASAEAASTAANDKIAALEATVADLTGKVAEQAEQPSAALAIAASALKATIDRGDPFMTEIETYASIAPQSPEIESLRGMAASGVPSRTAIADEFPAVANAMIAAAKAEDPDAGFLDRLMSSAQSLVQVRPVGMVEGEGAPAIVARMEVALQKGDYAAAIAEFDKLPEPAKAAGAEFIAKVKARHAADGLVDTILSSALKA